MLAGRILDVAHRGCAAVDGRSTGRRLLQCAAWTRTKDQRIMRSGLRRETAGIRAFCVRLLRADRASAGRAQHLTRDRAHAREGVPRPAPPRAARHDTLAEQFASQPPSQSPTRAAPLAMVPPSARRVDPANNPAVAQLVIRRRRRRRIAGNAGDYLGGTMQVLLGRRRPLNLTIEQPPQPRPVTSLDRREDVADRWTCSATTGTLQTPL